MSGLASIVLAFLSAYSPPSDSGKHALQYAAVACFVVASFAVWYEERKDRLRLEREHGPQIYIEIMGPGPLLADLRSRVGFLNKGDDVATNIQFSELPDEPIKILMEPWIIPLIGPNEHKEMFARFYRELQPEFSEQKILADHLSAGNRQMNVNLTWNSSGFGKCTWPTSEI